MNQDKTKKKDFKRISKPSDTERNVPGRERDELENKTDCWKFGPLGALHKKCESALTAISTDNLELEF